MNAGMKRWVISGGRGTSENLDIIITDLSSYVACVKWQKHHRNHPTKPSLSPSLDDLLDEVLLLPDGKHEVDVHGVCPGPLHGRVDGFGAGLVGCGE